jgi:uncharacterized protein DUF6265
MERDMRNKSIITVAAVVSAAFFVTLFAQRLYSQSADGKTANSKDVVRDMSWLAGTWSGSAWGGTFVAYYSAPSGGKIISHSKLIKDGRERFYEFEVFEAKGSSVFLQPFPGGKKVVGLTLVSHDRRRRKAEFENPTKDYPTRITYHCPSANRLVITLSDPHNKSDKTETFDLSRH